jgi:dTDP-4-amino-4,6-dideoxygalactose transaminase
VIRLAVPDIDESDVAAVAEVLRSGHLVQGARVHDFEAQIGNYVGAKYAIAVSSCTAALHLSLLATGIRPGDRVAVPTYSWPATANAVVLCGAEPVFVEIEPRTFNLDPAALAETLAAMPGITAVMPVHAFGGMADMTAIMDICGRHGIPVVEDAACALGARLDGRSAGTWGALGCFSFHPRKLITTGEGGVIVTDDAAADRRLRALRNHGQDPLAQRPDFIEPGYNLRMTEFQAALGLVQLGKLDRILSTRRSLAENYSALLENRPLVPPCTIEELAHTYQSYVVLVDGPPERRDRSLGGLRAAEVEAAIGTHHVPLTTYFRGRYGFRPGSFPVTDSVAQAAITLPLHGKLTHEQQQQIVSLASRIQ